MAGRNVYSPFKNKNKKFKGKCKTNDKRQHDTASNNSNVFQCDSPLLNKKNVRKNQKISTGHILALH
jgi:hypothetical protein